MSAPQEIKRLTAPDIRARKGGPPIVSLTSYHAHTARLVDAHCDVILVGDSLGMVMHGFETTVPVTLDMMILQGLAVMRGSRRALVVVDMPFGSYEASKEIAFASAARVMKETGCGAIKLEGGTRMAETIRFLVERGVPVMGHIGLTPQARPRRLPRAGAGGIGLGTVRGGCAGRRRCRRVLAGHRSGRRAAGAAHHAECENPHHRHRRQLGLRRSDPGAGGYAGTLAAGAEIRAPLWRSWTGNREGHCGLCRRCARPRFSRPRACLWHEAEKAVSLRHRRLPLPCRRHRPILPALPCACATCFKLAEAAGEPI